MAGKAILKDGEIVLTDDVLEWAAWYENHDRRVAFTEISETTISTVFLGLDYSIGVGPPLWFETLVSGGPLNDEMARYPTLEAAMHGHEHVVGRVRAAQN